MPETPCRAHRGDHQDELADGAEAVTGYDKLAVYAQDQFSIITDRLRAVIGARFDASSDLFESKTSPRAALVYTPNDRLVVRGGYSTAFRFPSFSELYQDTWFINVENERGLAPTFPLAVFGPNAALTPYG